MSVHTRVFSGKGGASELYCVIESEAGTSFDDQVRQVHSRYQDVLTQHHFGEESAVFRRLFLSDSFNQADAHALLPLVGDDRLSPVAVSTGQQSPLSGAKIALLAYHIDDGAMKKARVGSHHVLVERNGTRCLWSTGLSAPAARGADTSASAQTTEVFRRLIEALSGLGGTLADHCQRTWLYVKDIDVFYDGMVESRSAVFERAGLTKATHYIASTAIEGGGAHPFGVVSLDAYSCLDITPEQILYLNSEEMLCKTDLYQVTFERGTCLSYADRKHLFISGTASIDNQGNTLYVGDVMRQCDRALDNIAALLAAGGARLSDLLYVIVYLRDPTDYLRVGERLRAVCGETPCVIVQGAVCRPAWLIEIEGVAAVANDNPGLPCF